MPKDIVDNVSRIEWEGSETWRGLTDWEYWKVSKACMKVEKWEMKKWKK